MATLFDEEDRQLVELTGQQAALINHFGRDRRMVVTGCAGSGKTMLAVERARQLAAAGRRVLFVCFNRALCAHLGDTVEADGLEFSTFHGLCVHLARRAGVAPAKPEGTAPPEYWSHVLPDALVEGIGVLGGQYDDILRADVLGAAELVDEAQDLHSDWLAALTCTLHDEEKGSIWLFMDGNQRVYDVTLEVPDEYRPFDLTVNCRNTQAIHAEVMKLYQGVVKPEVKGPPGRMPQLLHTDDEAGAVAGVLDDLCGPQDIRRRTSSCCRLTDGSTPRSTAPTRVRGSTPTSAGAAASACSSRRSGASRAWSPRWWSSASWATSTRSPATTRSTSACRGLATTA